MQTTCLLQKPERGSLCREVTCSENTFYGVKISLPDSVPFHQQRVKSTALQLWCFEVESNTSALVCVLASPPACWG